MLKGGNHLLNNEEEIFSFELNESLFFEKGQEVSEMLGISLEPEISIQQFNEYVSIRGVIELHGEYQKVPKSEDDKNDLLEYEDNHSYRYLEKIEDTTDNRAEFLHRFPVEISVPTYRVPDINNVTVRIDMFDYEIPDNRELNLKSIIAIHGINNLAELPRDEQEVDTPLPVEGISESFEFEVENEPLETNQEINETEAVGELNTSKEDKKRWQYTKSQTFQEFFTDEDKEDPAQVSLSDEKEESEEVEVLLSGEEDAPSTSATVSQDTTEAVTGEEAEIEADEEDTEDTLRGMDYVADMFRTDEESEEFTRLQLCIVQAKDTLETIAERYEVPKLQLLKQNRLEHDHILEGQLLSIPYKKSKD